MIKRIQKNVMYLHHNQWFNRYVIFYKLGKSLYNYKSFDPLTNQWLDLSIRKNCVRLIRMDLRKLTNKEKLELL